ncbi:hypothetical protein HNV08_05575 [Winogradskyella eckloniae]|uniref:hypothetical protein n=1 Tax=Winogradskyella eckloniae TaxID=1089306 RepID=UPI0015667D68|nr:hypothetical protein [Winogradskyella eckloniae]NRD19508.1 hypothetical protein [Winogradskyella eckloniae]
MNLLERLDQLIEKLNSEMLRLYHLEKKYSLTALGINKNLDKYSKEEVSELLLKHNIKKKSGHGIISWNSEYKEEVLNHVYPQILQNNLGNIELLIPEFRQEIEIGNSKKINKFLSKKLKGLNKKITGHDGFLFIDPDYRQRKNNLLKNRFDAIWNINEQFLAFPLSKRNENSFVISSLDYPFIEFDMQQWCDLELSYHLIPIFKEAMGVKPLECKELKSIYVEYEHIFKSFDAFNFTYKTIKNLKENIPSEIESLYEFLFKEILIVNRKTKFKEYLLNAHGIQQTKIRDYTNLVNYQHEDRVKKYQSEWTKFLKKT